MPGRLLLKPSSAYEPFAFQFELFVGPGYYLIVNDD